MAYPKRDEGTSPRTVLEPLQKGTGDVSHQGRLHVRPIGQAPDINPNIPPPKTDKPRPHICTTCTRAFARLEHLKRHERSHTKEKPFACNECTRCFARRDLLLRHQQKLHMTAPPSSRSRRRESTSSTTVSGSTRVRKNSMASNPPGISNSSMRPRANTISHVDNSTLGMIAAVNSPQHQTASNIGFAHPHMNGLPGVGKYHYRGMSSSSGHHGNMHVLPKLETKKHFVGIVPGLHTAPPRGNFASEMSRESLLFGHSSTINPAHLHFSSSPQNMGYDSPLSPLHPAFSGALHGPSSLDVESGGNWLHNFDQQMSFQDENAIDNSSPSAVDSASPEALNEAMFEGSANITTSPEWHQPSLDQAPLQNGFSFDASQQPFVDLPMAGALSPKTSNFQTINADQYFSTPPPFPPPTPSQFFDVNPFLMSENPVKPETPSNSAASITSSNRQSSVTSMSTDSISDATRQALINSLSEPLGQGHGFLRTTSSPNHSSGSDLLGGKIVPSTQDLQRYVAAYIRYFHPHLPFLHVATLAFDAPDLTGDLSSSGHQAFEQGNIFSGAGSLVLAMASIGALYEYDFASSKDLSDMSKHLIQLYLQERSREDPQNVNCVGGNGVEMNSQNTPLWLVQAMLLNVVYGHNSGDKKAAGIANTQCASLISLARGADLVRPTEVDSTRHRDFHLKQTDLQLSNDDPAAWSGYISHPALELEKEWHTWKVVEERKRTLFAIFIFSSLLVSAYNSAPALMNSEILLDLPCDERLWCADSPEAWRAVGGSTATLSKETSFASALSFLLSASQRKQQKQRRMSHSFDVNVQPESLPEEDLRPSTFGCLILINALHNYIWETRQHHAGRPWTPRDTDKLHAHMEPALRAWQAAWSSNTDHSLERPNPFGATSMSADCIPLLDLAYVRLFVNLGRTKDLFFQRNWDAMAEELANGPEIVEHGEHSPASSPGTSEKPASAVLAESLSAMSGSESTANKCSAKCSRRESHLRKAAYCAANSLMMSDRLNVTFADYNSRELPLHSALCAFDCAQIIAEWISTVQQRVGRCLGILGRDNIDLGQAPACMLLEDDDCKLLEKVKEIIDNANAKLDRGFSMNANPTVPDEKVVELENCGYGSKILSIHARMFERDAVWPVCHEISLALRTQAAHIKTKTEMSLSVLA